MSYIVSLLILTIPLLVVATLPAVFGVSTLMKIWLTIRERNMKKFAKENGLQFKSNIPSYKQCIYLVAWPYALKEDWKTNFIEGSFKRHSIFICDNLFSGPRFLFKSLNPDIRRTVVEIDSMEVKGKEYKTQFLKFQDGGLTSIWELRRILKNLS